MSVLYVVVPLALLMSAGAVVTFLWAVRRGQFDDIATPAVRILHDDLPAATAKTPPEAPR
jgi:cbb3-type cytochrome oxidase maturation protein